MLVRLARRLVMSVVVLVGVSFVSFWAVAAHINPLYPLLFQTPRPTELIDRLTASSHLSEPIPARYGHWLLGIFTGDDSNRMVLSHQPIWPLVGMALAHTAELAAASIVVIVVLSVVAGAAAAHFRGSLLDLVVRGLGSVTWSIPTFLVALVLQEAVTRLGSATGWHPFYLPGLPGAKGSTSGIGAVVDWVRHMTLPVITVSLCFVGAYARYIRSSLLVALDAPYSTVARAKGLPERSVLLRHALRNASIPFVAVLSLEFGGLIGATFVADLLFGLQGLGSLFFFSISIGDPLLTESLMMATAAGMLLFSLLGDIASVWLDPRIRLS
ncbi:MAG: ABC transporter permease [Gaiellaceae bacterium]